MIFEGIKLSILGMLVVFSFLILLVLIVRLSTHLLKSYTEQEERELERLARAKSLSSVPGMDRGRLVAVISAAISAHRRRSQSLHA